MMLTKHIQNRQPPLFLYFIIKKHTNHLFRYTHTAQIDRPLMDGLQRASLFITR